MPAIQPPLSRFIKTAGACELQSKLDTPITCFRESPGELHLRPHAAISIPGVVNAEY